MEDKIFLLDFESLFLLPGSVKIDKVSVEGSTRYWVSWYLPYDNKKYILGPSIHCTLDENRQIIEFRTDKAETHDEFAQQCQEMLSELFGGFDDFE